MMMRACFVVLWVTSWALAEAKPLARVWEQPTPNALPQGLLVDQQGRAVLYVALKQGGLQVCDLAEPTKAPKVLAHVERSSFEGLDVMAIAQQKDVLFLALGDFFNANGADAGLAMVSVANPRRPKVLALWKSPAKWQGAAAVLVHDRYVYLGAMSHGIAIFEVREQSLKHLTTYLPDVDFPLAKPTKVQHPNARGFALQGSTLYVAYDAGGLRTLDITNPAKPVPLGRYVNTAMGKKQQAFNNIALAGQTAYVAVDYAGLEVLDIRDPKNIKPIAWWNPWEAHTLQNIWLNSAGHTNQIVYDAKTRQVFLSAGDRELLVLDVANPRQPLWTDYYGEPKDKLGAWGLAVGPKQVYLAYIHAVVPFQGTWSGIKAVSRR